MNYIYVDSSVKASGDGTQESPYKQLSDVLSLTTLTHPVSILLKRGLVYTGGNNDANNLMYNTTDQISFIGSYGVGSRPLISQGNVSCLILPKARNLTISGIGFIGTMSITALASISPCMYGDDVKTNVWLDNVKFKGMKGKQQKWQPALWMTANTSVNGSAGYFGVRNSEFNGTARGIWIMGNGNVPSGVTDNTGDRYYGNGIRVENTSFIDVGGDGCIMSNACSPDDPLSSQSDTDTSGMFSLKYRSLRNDFPSTASVVFWLSNCNKVVMRDMDVDGCTGAKNGYDKQAYDFDILCHNCLLEDSYSRNTSGFMITSNYASQVTAMPSGETPYSWYYTKGYGNTNNTVRNCTSFNDGCYPGRPKIIWQGYTFGLKLQNVTFIDTVNTDGVAVSMFRDSTSLYTLTDNVYGIEFENVLFYFPNANTLRLVSSDSAAGTTALTSANNNLLYASDGVTPVFPTDGLVSDNLTTDPMFLNLEFSSPGSFKRANMLMVNPASGVVSGGTATDNPDYNGNTGSSIGCIQY